MQTKLINTLRNLSWITGIFRTTIFVFLNVWLCLELFDADTPFRLKLPWDSKLATAVNWTLIPIGFIAIEVTMLIYCIRGFRDPQGNLSELARRARLVATVLFMIGCVLFVWGFSNSIALTLVMAGVIALGYIIVEVIGNYLQKGLDKPDDRT